MFLLYKFTEFGGYLPRKLIRACLNCGTGVYCGVVKLRYDIAVYKTNSCLKLGG